MVRVFLLRPEERIEIAEYIRDRPPVMSDNVRQARMRSRWIDYDQLRKDVDLVERLSKLRIPKGRGRIIKAGFTVKGPEEMKD